MRVAVLILAIFGAVLGVVFSFFAMTVGSIYGAFTGDATIVLLGLSALGACVFAIVCAGVNFGSRRKKLAAFGLIIAALWHVISISAFGIPGLIFFLLAGILGFFVEDTTDRLDESPPPPDEEPSLVEIERTLRSLESLREGGLLTDAEYEAARQRALDGR